MTVSVKSVRAQNLLIGPEFIRVQGLTQAGVVVTQDNPTSKLVEGLQGDSMFVAMDCTAHTIAFSVLPTSPTLTLLAALSPTPFPCSYEIGPAKISGWAMVADPGALSGGADDDERAITLAFAKEAGNLLAPVGQILGQ